MYFYNIKKVDFRNFCGFTLESKNINQYEQVTVYYN